MCSGCCPSRLLAPVFPDRIPLPCPLSFSLFPAPYCASHAFSISKKLAKGDNSVTVHTCTCSSSGTRECMYPFRSSAEFRLFLLIPNLTSAEATDLCAGMTAVVGFRGFFSLCKLEDFLYVSSPSPLPRAAAHRCQ